MQNYFKTTIVSLSGSSKDRRKQLRQLRKKFPDAEITVTAKIYLKDINGKKEEVEDANSTRSLARIKIAVPFEQSDEAKIKPKLVPVEPQASEVEESLPSETEKAEGLYESMGNFKTILRVLSDLKSF